MLYQLSHPGTQVYVFSDRGACLNARKTVVTDTLKHMMYPYMTLNDDTEITHSEMKPDGRVKVYFETPDDNGGFRNATCYLPDYTWENVSGYSVLEMEYFKHLLRNNAHLIIEFSQEGGFENASNI